MFTNHIYIYIYKEDLALNNLQWFLYNKTQWNKNQAQSVGSVEYIDYISAEG